MSFGIARKSSKSPSSKKRKTKDTSIRATNQSQDITAGEGEAEHKSMRSSSQDRREPTPNTRALANIRAVFARASEKIRFASQSMEQEQSQATAPSISEDNDSSSLTSVDADSEYEETATEQTQVLKAPVKLGRK
jgi:hypothetical protein